MSSVILEHQIITYPESQLKLSNKMTVDTTSCKSIYIDLDDTLYDFASIYKSRTGFHPKELTDEEFWIRLNNDPVGIFSHGRPLYGYLEFLSLVVRVGSTYGYTVKILSALSPHNELTMAEQIAEKNAWVKKHITEHGFRIPAIYTGCAEDKKLYSSDGEILIDDRMSNVDDWLREGGYGIYHRNFQDSTHDLCNALEKLRE